MPEFSDESLARLSTCDYKLQHLFKEVVKQFDCTVIEGYRSERKQLILFQEGRSKVEKGKHNTTPSMAVDVAPYPIDWDDKERFYYFAGFVKAVSILVGVDIRWGGDWDDDKNMDDQTFNDLTHFEIRG